MRRKKFKLAGHLKVAIKGLQVAWNWLPKEGKVAIYILGAVIIEKGANILSPDFLSFVPIHYRLGIYNIAEVLLVETAKRLRKK